MSGDVAHMALQRTRNATMQGRCVWHWPVIIVCMLRWVFTVRTEANKITISPLRGPRFYCTLQSILRYLCSCSNFTRLSGSSAIAAPTMHSFIPSHTRSSPHDSCTLPLHNLLLHAPIHIRQQSASRIGGVGDCCRGRPKVQWLYSSSPHGNAAIAAMQRDAVPTATHGKLSPRLPVRLQRVRRVETSISSRRTCPLHGRQQPPLHMWFNVLAAYTRARARTEEHTRSGARTHTHAHTHLHKQVDAPAVLARQKHVKHALTPPPLPYDQTSTCCIRLTHQAHHHSITVKLPH